MKVINDSSRMVKVGKVKTHPQNPRVGNIDVVVESIKENGFFGALIVQKSTGHILVGNHRYLAAIEAGADEVPVTYVDIDDERATKIMLADNRTSDMGEYNDTVLVELLQGLGDIKGTGYEPNDLEELLASLEEPIADEEIDEIPETPSKPRTKKGDVWLLGGHRVMCGDSSNYQDVQTLLGGELIDFMFTSPPYNVGVGYDSHDDSVVPWKNYRDFLGAALDAWAGNMMKGHAVAWNLATYPKTYHAHQHVLLESFGLTYLRTLVWQKVGVPVPLWHHTRDNPVARQFTPNYTHEIVLVFVNGDKLDRGGPVKFDETLQHDVFQIAQHRAGDDIPDEPSAARVGGSGTSARKGSNLETRARKAHPAPFPVRLPEVFIQHLADRDGIVADPFLGAGSTLIACQARERRCCGMEIEPKYVDVTCQRFEKLFGIRPVRMRDGNTEEVSFL